jgi:predicted TIM-barrel fold metal-dependent hydrolase
MIIDGHAHAAGEYSTSNAIREATASNRIDKVVLCPSPKNRQDLGKPPSVPFMNSPNSIYLLNRMLRLGYRAMKDNGDGNRYVSALKESLPQQVCQFLWVNPLDPLHISGLEQAIQNRHVSGIKLHQAWDSFRVDSPAFSQVVEIAQSHNLPVFVHLFSKRETSALAGFVANHREVVFVIGHMLGLDIFEASRAHLRNVFFDTSGSERVRGRDILHAVRTFGDDHVVFGSDTPYAPVADQIRKISRLGLADDALDRIFGRNMDHLLSLRR